MRSTFDGLPGAWMTKRTGQQLNRGRSGGSQSPDSRISSDAYREQLRLENEEYWRHSQLVPGVRLALVVVMLVGATIWAVIGIIMYALSHP